MKYYSMVEHKGAGMAARFYIDGVRVSRAKYEHIDQMAHMYGHVDTFHTIGRPIGTLTRRTNYKTARIES